MMVECVRHGRPWRWFSLALPALLALVSQSAAVYKIPLRRMPFRVAESVVARASGEELPQPLPTTPQNLRGRPGEGYYVSMDIGTPTQTLNVLVDTGSSNFAVASSPHPDVDKYFSTSDSSSYVDLRTPVDVPYTQGSWEGSLGRDLAALTSMDNVSVDTVIAFIKKSENFFIEGSNWQGILGLAYAEIARPSPSTEPFLDALERQTHINQTFSLQMCGATRDNRDVGGNLVIGGIDQSLYSGDIFYVPVYKRWYYEIVLTAMSVDGEDVDIDCKEFNFDKTIVDSGTTNLRLPHLAFNNVLRMIQESTKRRSSEAIPDLFWSGEDLLCWPERDTPWDAFPPLTVSMATDPNSTVTLTVAPQQYLRVVTPEEVASLGLVGDNCYKFAISVSDTGTVLGAVFMEAYYVVFDRENSRVGFAASKCRGLQGQPQITGPHPHPDTSDCAYQKPGGQAAALLVVAYVLAAVCALCLLPLLVLLVHWQATRCRQERRGDSDHGDGLLPGNDGDQGR